MVMSVAMAAVGGPMSGAGLDRFTAVVERLALNDDLKARCMLSGFLLTKYVPSLMALGLGEMVEGRFAPNDMFYSVAASAPMTFKLAKSGSLAGSVSSVDWNDREIDEHLSRIRRGEKFPANGYSTKISASFREFASPLCGSAEIAQFTVEDLRQRLNLAMLVWNGCVMAGGSTGAPTVAGILELVRDDAQAQSVVEVLRARKEGAWGFDKRLIVTLAVTKGEGTNASVRVECVDTECGRAGAPAR